MLEWERLAVVRRTFQAVTKIGLKGRLSVHSLFSLGKAAHSKVAKAVGLIMSENDPLPGTVKHL